MMIVPNFSALISNLGRIIPIQDDNEAMFLFPYKVARIVVCVGERSLCRRPKCRHTIMDSRLKPSLVGKKSRVTPVSIHLLII